MADTTMTSPFDGNFKYGGPRNNLFKRIIKYTPLLTRLCYSEIILCRDILHANFLYSARVCFRRVCAVSK